MLFVHLATQPPHARMTPEQLLHKLKPSHRDNAAIEQIRAHACELQTLIDAAHLALCEIYEPDDLGKNDLVDWAGHSPLQIEYATDRKGVFELVSIRVRGADLPSDCLDERMWIYAREEVERWNLQNGIEREELRADHMRDLKRDERMEA